MVRRGNIVFPKWRQAPTRSSGRRIEDLVAQLRMRYDPLFLNDHPKRVALISVKIARVLGYSSRWCRRLAVVALFHDIGKVHPECKHYFTTGHLDYSKSDTLGHLVTKIHQELGLKVLERVRLGSCEPYRKKIATCIGHHHDPFDQRPRLPREVYIVSVVDAWDAMTSNVPDEVSERGDRNQKSPEKAAAILYEGALRGKFDPEACRALVSTVLGMEEPEVFFQARSASRRRVRG